MLDTNIFYCSAGDEKSQELGALCTMFCALKSLYYTYLHEEKDRKVTEQKFSRLILTNTSKLPPSYLQVTADTASKFGYSDEGYWILDVDPLESYNRKVRASSGQNEVWQTFLLVLSEFLRRLRMVKYQNFNMKSGRD